MTAIRTTMIMMRVEKQISPVIAISHKCPSGIWRKSPLMTFSRSLAEKTSCITQSFSW